MTVEESWATIEQHLAASDALDIVRGPASEDDIADLRDAVRPLVIPDDLVSSLRRHNGGQGQQIVVDDFVLFSTADATENYFDMADAHVRGAFLGDGWWSTDWLPFAVSAGGDFFCVDLRRGGVFYHAHDSGPFRPKYRSFEEWLESIAEAIRAGRTVVRERKIEAAVEGNYFIDLGMPLQ
jgi:cell wall assembly regulator SMI1